MAHVRALVSADASICLSFIFAFIEFSVLGLPSQQFAQSVKALVTAAPMDGCGLSAGAKLWGIEVVHRKYQCCRLLDETKAHHFSFFFYRHQILPSALEGH